MTSASSSARTTTTSSGTPCGTARRQRQRQRFGEQHQATAGFTDALVRFLGAPASVRVIETLNLKLILTRRDYVHRLGELVGAAADAGTVKSIELELVTEMEMAMASVALDADAWTKLGYGERFGHFLQDCPGRRVPVADKAQPAEPVVPCHPAASALMPCCWPWTMKTTTPGRLGSPS